MSHRTQIALVRLQIAIAEELLEKVQLWEIQPPDYSFRSPQYVWHQAVQGALDQIRTSIEAAESRVKILQEREQMGVSEPDVFDEQDIELAEDEFFGRDEAA